ncbi:MAG: hypothetical protein GEU73_02415 [Chloroflexi bacterium]|nr:hypothetical protein [Chloroflexota bacterium]
MRGSRRNENRRRSRAMASVGSGDYAYEALDTWGTLPEGFRWGQIGAVNVDSDDRVYVFTRTEHPLMVFERDGRYVRSLGEGVIQDAHGLCIGPQGDLFVVDRAAHVVMKFSNDWKKLFELGNRDQPSDTGWTPENRTVLRAAGPFNYPTDVAFSANGDFYVSDGYRNARVHKYSADGQLLSSWGEPGRTRPGEFNLVHSVWEARGRLHVADRENNRIQVFSPDGEFIEMWTDFAQPADIYVDDNDIMYVAELSGRVTLLTLDGTIVERIGSLDDRVAKPGRFVAPHGIWADRHGDFYVSEVLQGQRIQKFVRT